MSLAVTSVISAGVAVTGLAYSIANSEQQKRIASQKEDAAKIDAASAQSRLTTQQNIDNQTQQRNLALSNERRRLGSPVAAVTSGAPPVAQPTTPSTTSPATVTRGTGTLLGS